MLDINNYPEEFIKWVDENISELACEEAELCGENIAGIIIDDWEAGKYDNLENEIDIWFEHYGEDCSQSIDGEQAKQDSIN